VIVYERQGTTLVYSLNVSAFEEALGAVIELFSGARRPRLRKERRA
jgi:hypothetical protein